MSTFSFRYIQFILICLGLSFFYACSAQKEGASGKGIQNLTARYNYIYNANIMLDDYVSDLHHTYPDNYNEVLPVHLSPQGYNPSDLQAGTSDKALDEIISKSRTIITDKSLSNYIDDAYLLMGKSQYYKGNFFLAAEYFGYVSKVYKNNQSANIQALDWQARSYMRLNDLKSAALTLDTLEKNLNSIKKNRAEPYATLAQMALQLNEPKTAIPYLQTAIKESKDKRNTIRWHFILAQIFEQQQSFDQALYHLKKVQSSNAGFELYFNAKLKQVKLNALLKGSNLSREQQLLSLLKDEKNLDFSNQIYYHIGEYFREEQNYPQALNYYNRSITTGGNNTYLQGLAYLQLAELNFQRLRNYLQAKKYYDSTLLSLPKSYAGYDLILKKSQNLEYLSSRYQIIAHQDTLQALAKLSEVERIYKARNVLFPVKDSLPIGQAPANAQSKSGTFYFNNSRAMERGSVDFHKKWGNRKLENNWRQSIRVTTTNTQRILNSDQNNGLLETGSAERTSTDSITLSNYLALIPVNKQMLESSDQKIINTYFELASFYQQELKDTKEATRIYEYLLNTYPQNNQIAAINYSLYLIYLESDQQKAAAYKSKVLTDYASSTYANTILDPNFSSKQHAKDFLTDSSYNTLFNLYHEKSYEKVIQAANQHLTAHPDNHLAAQFAYLKAISVGRTKPVDSLLGEFQSIKVKYANDQLIIPLIDDHLNYINQHLAEFKRRKIALIDFDPNEPRFIPQLVIEAQAPVEKVFLAQAKVPATEPKRSEIQVKEAITGVFKKTEASTWYFVIDVADATIRLSSSRFGIGQFNRGNYPESNLRHQLVEFGDDQLIYVGNFSSFEAVKAYQERIVPQLTRIMRERPALYNAFIISKENFELLNSKSLLNQYQEFYKKNY